MAWRAGAAHCPVAGRGAFDAVAAMSTLGGGGKGGKGGGGGLGDLVGDLSPRSASSPGVRGGGGEEHGGGGEEHGVGAAAENRLMQQAEVKRLGDIDKMLRGIVRPPSGPRAGRAGSRSPRPGSPYVARKNQNQPPTAEGIVYDAARAEGQSPHLRARPPVRRAGAGAGLAPLARSGSRGSEGGSGSAEDHLLQHISRTSAVVRTRAVRLNKTPMAIGTFFDSVNSPTCTEGPHGGVAYRTRRLSKRKRID